MRRPAALPPDWADFARSALPIGLLALAAAIPPVRIPALLLLGAGTAIAISRDAPVRWAWAGAVPVSVSLAWGILTPPGAAVDGSDCANPASPTATWRIAEAVVVLAVLALLGIVLHASRTSLFVRVPAKAVVRWSIVGFLVAGPLALLVGPLLAAPFFGEISYSVLAFGAIVPALGFAIANGTMEELAYRGALLGWSSRVVGVWPAVVGQAIVFGLAHSGADVVGNGVVLSVALGIGGLLAGIIAVRTRSLLLPIAIHAGLDIPIYYAFACST